MRGTRRRPVLLDIMHYYSTTRCNALLLDIMYYSISSSTAVLVDMNAVLLDIMQEAEVVLHYCRRRQ